MLESNITKFRSKMDSGEYCLGVGITLCDPAVVEALAPSVDFFWIDLEHNPTNLETMQAHLIAARAGGTAAIVRIPSGDIAWVKRVLDSGAEGVILPQAQSYDEVAAFVSACRYPPMGTRGFGPRRPTNYGRNGGEDYLTQANETVFVVAQIESMGAFNDLDRIVKIPGLNSLVIGPNDLSGSMGMLGQTTHPDVLTNMREIVAKGREAGLYIGAGMGAEKSYAQLAAEMGIQWIQAGNDFEYMVQRADGLYNEVRGVK